MNNLETGDGQDSSGVEGDERTLYPGENVFWHRKGTFSKMVSKGLAITPIGTPLLKENKKRVNKRVSEESKRECCIINRHLECR